jgi:hypothetical protein
MVRLRETALGSGLSRSEVVPKSESLCGLVVWELENHRNQFSCLNSYTMGYT